jgi:branched-chain amino acid transport system permease protein
MNRRKSYIAIAIIVVILAIVGQFIPDYYSVILTQAMIFAIFAMSLDILVGYTGLGSLGHGAFFGVAGYGAAFLNVKVFQAEGISQFGMEILAGIVCAAVIAAIFGLLVLHTRGIYFLMLTLALSMLLWGLIYKWNVVGGSNGLYGMTRPDFGFISLADPKAYFNFVLICFAIAIILMYLIISSSFGRTLLGIKHNELRMRSLGYNVWLHTYIAYILAGAFAGLAGTLFVTLINYSSPLNLHLTTSAQVMLMVILGGAGTMFGPALGAGIIIFLKDAVSSVTERWVMIIGILYILVIIFMPNGIFGILRMYIPKIKIKNIFSLRRRADKGKV